MWAALVLTIQGRVNALTVFGGNWTSQSNNAEILSRTYVLSTGASYSGTRILISGNPDFFANPQPKSLRRNTHANPNALFSGSGLLQPAPFLFGKFFGWNKSIKWYAKQQKVHVSMLQNIETNLNANCINALAHWCKEIIIAIFCRQIRKSLVMYELLCPPNGGSPVRVTAKFYALCICLEKRCRFKYLYWIFQRSEGKTQKP